MTDEIPEWAIEQARALRDKLCLDTQCTFDNGCGCLDAICAALASVAKAERERAAKRDDILARLVRIRDWNHDYAESARQDYDNLADIAAAIRALPVEGSKDG